VPHQKDLLSYCNDQGMKPNEFQYMFCRRCRNHECVHAMWGSGQFDRRMATQVERLLTNPNIIEDLDARWKDIQALDFPNMFQKAMQLEIADQRGDWTVPEVPSIDVTDDRNEVAEETTTNAVDDALRHLARVQGKAEPKLPDPSQAEVEAFHQETERMVGMDLPIEAKETPQEAPPPMAASPVEPPPPPPEDREPPLRPAHHPDPVAPERMPVIRNVPNPQAGIMVGGESAPAPVDPAAPKQEPPAHDPWAAPPPKPDVVPVGAKIRMGLSNVPDKDDE